MTREREREESWANHSREAAMTSCLRWRMVVKWGGGSESATFRTASKVGQTPGTTWRRLTDGRTDGGVTGRLPSGPGKPCGSGPQQEVRGQGSVCRLAGKRWQLARCLPSLSALQTSAAAAAAPIGSRRKHADTTRQHNGAVASTRRGQRSPSC